MSPERCARIVRRGLRDLREAALQPPGMSGERARGFLVDHAIVLVAALRIRRQHLLRAGPQPRQAHLALGRTAIVTHPCWPRRAWAGAPVPTRRSRTARPGSC